MDIRPTPNNSRLLFRGATRACPVCGQRGLTQRVVDIVASCPRCDFRFERKPGHFIGAVGINTIITFGLILISILGGLYLAWPDPEFWPLIIAPFAVAAFVPPLLQPTAKTLWVGIDLMMNPLEAGEALGGSG